MTRRIPGATIAGAAILVGLCAVTPAVAQLSTNLPKPKAAVTAPPLPPTAPAVADAAREAARVEWEAMPEAARAAIQEGLVWTGDYAGALDGTFGRMTFEAIRAFQGRHGLAADGIATPAMTKALAEAAAKKRDAVGFRMVDDKATGTRIGLPTKLLGKATKAEGGTRWTSADGRIDYRVYAVAGQDLAQLFERLKAEGPGHKVGYAVMRTDWFVVADTVGTRQGYARFERVEGGVRGFIVYHDPAIGPEFGRVVVATAGTFEAVPKPPGAVAAQTTTPSAGPAAATPTPPVAPPKPTSLSSTGLRVAPGRVLTVAAAVAECRSVAVGGRPIGGSSLDATGTLALLTVDGPQTPAALAVTETAATPGDRLAVVAIGAAGGSVAPGAAIAQGVRAALQRGALGAPVFDVSGRLVGLVGARPDERRLVGGLVPQATYPVIPAAAVAAVVTGAGGAVDRPAAAAPTTTAAIVAASVPRLVAVVCEK